MPSTKYVTIIGIGMDGWKTVTVEAMRAIESADVLIGAARMLEPFSYNVKPTLISYQSDEIAAFIQTKAYTRFAVLVSGDSGFYSLAASLTPLLASMQDVRVDVISGISTPVYFCSRLHMPWSDLHFVSLHGAQSSIVRQVCAHRLTFFLLGGFVTPAAICRRLTEYGRGNITVHIGENLALPDERIRSGKAAELTEIETDRLCALIAENPDWEAFLPCGIEDGQFVRGKVPMTKRDVRMLSLSRLELEEDSIVYDVGAGTGSVSVEIGQHIPYGTVYAIERDDGALALLEENRKKFSVDNMEIIRGEAPQALEELPDPDAVFIGGSGGNLGAIIEAVLAKNPFAPIVINTITLESMALMVELKEQFRDNYDFEITEFSVTHLAETGSVHMRRPDTPVMIIKIKAREGRQNGRDDR